MKAVMVEFDSPNFGGWAEKRLAFPETIKNGQKERVMVFIRSVVLCCKRSGSSFRFSGQRRGGILTFGDSRYGEKSSGVILKPRYKPMELRQELARMVGTENADKCLAVVCD